MTEAISIAEAKRILHATLTEPRLTILPNASDLHNADPELDLSDLLAEIWKASAGFDPTQTRRLLAKIPTDWEVDDATALMIDDFALADSSEATQPLREWLLSATQVPTRLPLADTLLERFGRHAPLEGCILVACQHLLGSTVAQLHYLNRLGIDWSDMHVLGKPYSTNRAAVVTLENLGIKLHPASLRAPMHSTDSASWYDTEMTGAIDALLGEVRNRISRKDRKRGRVLILDDGGALIQRVPQNLGLDFGHIAAVEQTTGGIHRLAKQSLGLPVVSIAKSISKLGIEAEYIGRSIVDELEMRLRRVVGRNSLKDEKCLLIGFGSVGAWVAHALIHERDVTKLEVFDRENRMAAVARAFRLNVTYDLQRALHEATVIIGCTGERAFPTTYDDAIGSEAMLFSGSSGNVEFNGLMSGMRRRWMSSRSPILQRLGDTDFARIHDDYCSDDLDGFWISNAGFPVNFSGALDPIPPEEIQVTRSLMIAGAIQANGIHGSMGAGLVKFDSEFDHCILEAVGKRVPASHLDD